MTTCRHSFSASLIGCQHRQQGTIACSDNTAQSDTSHPDLNICESGDKHVHEQQQGQRWGMASMASKYMLEKHRRSQNFLQYFRQTWGQKHLLPTWKYRPLNDKQVARSLQGTGWILPAHLQLTTRSCSSLLGIDCRTPHGMHLRMCAHVHGLSILRLWHR